MKDERKNILEEAGICVEEALERFMGSEALLEKFMAKFLADPNFEILQAAIKSGDQEAALKASHTLKGVCGNLAMKQLYEKFSDQVSHMRSGNWDEAAEEMAELEGLYEKVCEAIKMTNF